MNEYTKRQIMEQSRHQFIYGYDGTRRTEFLKSLEQMYPVKIGEDSPMAIYLENYTLPVIDASIPAAEKDTLITVAREHFAFSVFINIMESITGAQNFDPDTELMQEYFARLSRYALNPGAEELRGADDLLSALKEAQAFYLDYYQKCLLGNPERPDYMGLRFPFVELGSTLAMIKRAIANNSYFGIIVDKNQQFPILSTKAINEYVTRRINADMSMKIATDPESWGSYIDLGGVLAESVHDYGTVELDDSYDVYIRKLKNNRLYRE